MDWLQAFETMGFPAAFGTAALWILWKLLRPISDAHVRNVDAVAKANEINADANRRNAHALENLTGMTEKMAEMIHEQSTASREQSSAIRELLTERIRKRDDG